MARNLLAGSAVFSLFVLAFAASADGGIPGPHDLPDPDTSPPDTTKPVKVYILSGQSNMVGMGYVNDPDPGSLSTATAEGMFAHMVDAAGAWTVRNDVWYEGVITATAKKWLTVGCGSGAERIGPELQFGHIMGYYHGEPVLVLKASQGNRSLSWDCLPPGSPRFDHSDGYTYAGYGESPNRWPTASGGPSPYGWYAGKQYDDFFLDESDMGSPGWADATDYPGNCQVRNNGVTYISKSAHTSSAASEPGIGARSSTYWDLYSVYNVTDVLDNFGTKFPQWAAQGFEIAGYGWWQGHKDQSEPHASNYESNLVNLINEVRAYYETRYPGNTSPDAPFVIATIGFGGWSLSGAGLTVANAQLAVSGETGEYPEFEGNVKTVESRDYWRDVADSPGNEGHHYNNNAWTYMMVGDALGRAMVGLEAKRPFVTVDQETGEIRIVNPSDGEIDMALRGYSIMSAAGGLDADQWTPIAGNYDLAGDDSVDDDGNWSVLTGTNAGLSEEAEVGGGDGLIAIGGEVSLGVGAWVRNPTRDVQFMYTDANGVLQGLSIGYIGAPIVLGDLNFDGTVNGLDWPVFLKGNQSDLSALSVAEAYQVGDLDGDLDNDIYDFALFREAYELANPAAGAFEEMVAAYSVPEPTSLILLAAGAAGVGMRRRRRARRAHGPQRSPSHGGTLPRERRPAAVNDTGLGKRMIAGNRIRTVLGIAAVAMAILLLMTAPAGAVTVVEEQFIYEPVQANINGQDGGIGFEGPWVSTISHGRFYWIRSPGLEFTDVNSLELPVAGNALSRYGAAGRAQAHRLLSEESKAALTGDDTTMWFSALFQAPSAHRQAAFLFGTDPFTTAIPPVLAAAGDGFGFTLLAPDGVSNGDGTINALALDGSTVPTVVPGTFNPDVETSLIAGKINWKPDGTPDELYLFNVTDVSTEPLEEAAIASITNLDFDQSAFDTVAMWDTNNAITDEIRFGATFDDAMGNPVPPPLLTLKVNQGTGAMALVGDPSVATDINFYEITSEANSVDAANWLSLADQDYEEGGPPDGSGDGWEEAGGVGPHALAEGFLLGSSTIGASQSVGLGRGYDVGVGAEDLAFKYRTDIGAILEGLVEYVPSGIPGDADENGVVDAADYIALKTHIGQGSGATTADGDFDGDGDVDRADFLVLRANFGRLAPAGPVPEPSALAVLALGGLAVALRRRRT